MKKLVSETLEKLKESNAIVKVVDSIDRDIIMCEVRHLFDGKHNVLLKCKTKSFDEVVNSETNRSAYLLKINRKFYPPYKH